MTVRQLKSTWENLGRIDPLWAVLTTPEARHGRWDVNEFMATGRETVEELNRLAESHRLSLGHRVLDFGCGVGRISNALAELGADVVGVDIATSMIEQAKALNRHPDRLHFSAYGGVTLPFDDNSFDSAVSLIVIQHAPPAVQVAALLELQRVVRPGGLLVVQVPSHPVLPTAVAESARKAELEILSAPGELVVGTQGSIRARITNRSEQTWPADQLLKLGNHWNGRGGLEILDDGRAELADELAPNQSVELELPVVAPLSEGRYVVEVDIVQEFIAWWRCTGEQARREVVVLPSDEGTTASQPSVGPTQTDEPPEVEKPSSGGIEMHGLHIDLMRSLMAHCGHQIVDAVLDGMPGPSWVSYTYLVSIGG